MTEGIATMIKPYEHDGKFGSVGTPVIGFDIRIVDDDGNELGFGGGIGEIIGYGAGLMSRYHNQPEKTREILWKDERGRTYLRSGDMGEMDKDGFLFIRDRKKDMIISGGFNIFPADIEGIIARHPAVMDVAVVGVPHEKWGETPVAMVIKNKGHEGVTEKEVLEW
jgi:long-chain acyl-CoA synthetase